MKHIFTRLIAVLAIYPFSVNADDFNVTRFDDPVPDGCLVNDCSLREAVMAANMTQNDDTIILDSGNYELMISPDSMNEEETGDLDVTAGNITIQGNGHWLTTIDAQYLDRVFDIDEASLILKQIELLNGLVINEYGGGIRGTGGALTLEQVKMSGHFSSSFGGAIHGYFGLGPFQLTINQSIFSRNGSGFQRGAIGCSGCEVAISDSSIEFNYAEDVIIELINSPGFIHNTNINNNFSKGNLAVIYFSGGKGASYGDFDIINSTFSDNELNGATLNVLESKHSLIKGNTFINNTEQSFSSIGLENATLSDNIFGQKLGYVFGPVNSTGFNILSDIPIGSITLDDSDIVIDDTSVLDILELRNNGGIGKTNALGANSLARNFKTSNCELSDQKGISRNNPSCDVGAFQTGYCSTQASDIPDDDINGVLNQIEVDNLLEILNLEVYVDIEHYDVGELELELKHVNSGTTATLVNQPLAGACGRNMNLIMSELNGDAPEIETDCQSGTAFPHLSNKFKPFIGSLNAFNGNTLAGTWELKVIDHSAGSSGSLNQWCLYPELEFIDLIFQEGFELP